MSENTESTTAWQTDSRLRYVVPVAVGLCIILLILCLAAAFSGRNDGRGLKPFRPSRTPLDNGVSGEVMVVSFTELNNSPESFQNQRIRVTGDKVTIVPQGCRLYTGPVFNWGLIAEDLQLYALGYEEVIKRLSDGLTMTVEGVWRQYNGPLGCGKEPADGTAWYLQVERIVSPNPLPLVDGTPFATIQVPLGTRVELDITPFMTQIPGTGVTRQPGIGITPLPTDSTSPPDGTALPPATLTLVPTSTLDQTRTTNTPFPGLTPSSTPDPVATATDTIPGEGTATTTATVTNTPTPGPTVPGLITQTPEPTKPGYPGPGPSTVEPSATPYPGS